MAYVSLRYGYAFVGEGTKGGLELKNYVILPDLSIFIDLEKSPFLNKKSLMGAYNFGKKTDKIYSKNFSVCEFSEKFDDSLVLQNEEE